jgi:hypothetical protein
MAAGLQFQDLERYLCHLQDLFWAIVRKAALI